jgi:hypothetical protein
VQRQPQLRRSRRAPSTRNARPGAADSVNAPSFPRTRRRAPSTRNARPGAAEWVRARRCLRTRRHAPSTRNVRAEVAVLVPARRSRQIPDPGLTYTNSALGGDQKYVWSPLVALRSAGPCRVGVCECRCRMSYPTCQSVPWTLGLSEPSEHFYRHCNVCSRYCGPRPPHGCGHTQVITTRGSTLRSVNALRLRKGR